VTGNFALNKPVSFLASVRVQDLSLLYQIWPNNPATTANVPPLKPNRFSSHSLGLRPSMQVGCTSKRLELRTRLRIFTAGRMTPNQLCHCQRVEDKMFVTKVL